jgi:hypothetical protein
MNLARILLICALSVTLLACATYNTILTNPYGKKYTCSAEGFGLIGSTVATVRHNNCIAHAKELGYVSSN